MPACAVVDRAALGENRLVSEPKALWQNTTHDWAITVDTEHLARIHEQPGHFAPTGVAHLVLEVVAYAADEVGHSTTGTCEVTLHADGSVSVVDHGRGTDTRVANDGHPVRKPVMATKDLRFFDTPSAEQLPDGHPRRGMSVVAALSRWLVHTNRRATGSWTQRYEHGIPVTDLEPLDDDGTTGTTVRFLPDDAVRAIAPVSADSLRALMGWAHLAVDVVEELPPA